MFLTKNYFCQIKSQINYYSYKFNNLIKFLVANGERYENQAENKKYNRISCVPVNYADVKANATSLVIERSVNTLADLENNGALSISDIQNKYTKPSQFKIKSSQIINKTHVRNKQLKSNLPKSVR